MKRTAIDHPKLRRLSRLLDLPHYAAVGLMESIWHFTARHAIRGDLGKWADDEIADAIGWPAEKAGELVEAMVKARLLDHDDDYRLVVHDWHDHADDSVKKTLKKHGWVFSTKKVATVPERSGTVREQDGTDPERSDEVAEGGENVPDSHSHSHSRSQAKPEPSQSRSPEGSSESRSDSEPAFLVFPTVGNGAKTWDLLPSKVAEYRESFPGVDAEAEARKAWQWLTDNPPRRKTAKGMPAFLGRWFSRVQDLGRGSGNEAPPHGMSKKEQRGLEATKQWIDEGEVIAG